MWYGRKGGWAGALALLALLAAGGARAAVIDVCATCPETTLDGALAAAAPGDVIVLDGPTDVTDPAVDYTLGSALVIDGNLAGLTIRGKSSAHPHRIRIVGPGGAPVITVEENFSFTISGVTITGGTTGILAMQGSDVDIRRVLFDSIGGVSVDCVDPAEVYMAASIVSGGTGDAVRIDQGGALNITQCTFLDTTGGVNAIDGVATIEATLIHNCGAGVAGTDTTLDVGGLWVTDGGGNPLPLPAGVTDAHEVTDTLDPAIVFSADPDAFPGELADLTQVRRTGADSATLSSVEFFSRDFGNLGRSSSDLVVGADEETADITAATWTECYIIQRGQQRRWIGEGPITIQVVTPTVDLTNAVIWIANPLQGASVFDANNRIGPLDVNPVSAVDATFAFVDYNVVLENFETEFPAIADVNTDNYEIFIHATGGLPDGADVNFLDESDTAGSQAFVGRRFGFDSIPPVIVTNFNLLADQYLSGFTLTGDAGPPPELNIATPVPGNWGAGALLGETGANAGYLNGTTGDPSVFFDLPRNGIGISLTFTDVGSGFAIDGLPDGTITYTAPGEKDAVLYRNFAGVPGMAWWTPNSESAAELINSAAELTVTYNNVGGNTLETSWLFTDLLHDGVNQWHAIANVRVTDLAGNEATLDPSGQTFIPLKPFHLWWFPNVRGELRAGPSGQEVADPTFTWGISRLGGGQDPKDPLPCFSTVRWRVWGADAAGAQFTSWTDISGGWSAWMNPANKTITLDTIFTGTTRLRDLLVGPPGSEYLISVQGYDEAGNMQAGGAFGNLASVADLEAAVYDYRRWTDPGADASLGLDTQVVTEFWYERAGGTIGNRTRDAGEQGLGSLARIPLPPAETCERVEAGFSIRMTLPDVVPTAAARGVAFELYEDGRLVASGQIPGGPNLTLVAPYDLLANPGFIVAPFLNNSECFPGVNDRLGDDGPIGLEPPARQRDVKYTALFSSFYEESPGNAVFDRTPATVEFTVTSGRERGEKDDQPIKSFVKD
ncbi:MAG: hypothetical protein KF886_23120 [Candidatus Hydrogenedentes bacterium]|nr:hypothetical protein [Candidatus Hydrogenedentota bacterium]